MLPSSSGSRFGTRWYLSLRLHICLYVYTSVSISTYLSLRLHIFLYVYNLSVSLHICLYVYTSVSTFTHLSLRLYICLYVYTSVSTSTHLSLRLHICLYSTHLSLRLITVHIGHQYISKLIIYRRRQRLMGAVNLWHLKAITTGRRSLRERTVSQKGMEGYWN